MTVAPDAKRKPAPKGITVDPSAYRGDDRAKLIDHLEKQDKSKKFFYVREDTTAAQLRRMGAEIVRDGKEPIRFRNDIVACQSREQYVEERTGESKQSYDVAKRILGKKKNPAQIRKKANPVNPKFDEDD